MAYYRIDIKKESAKLPFIYTLLKWVVLVYVTLVTVFLLDKLYYLIFRHIAVAYEWLAILLNLLLIFILVRQLLRLNDVRYLIVADDQVKYRQRFPWTSNIRWNRMKEIQFGYSTIRFVTKTNKKYRFSISKISSEDQEKLYTALEDIAKKNGVEILRPM